MMLHSFLHAREKATVYCSRDQGSQHDTSLPIDPALPPSKRQKTDYEKILIIQLSGLTPDDKEMDLLTLNYYTTNLWKKYENHPRKIQSELITIDESSPYITGSQDFASQPKNLKILIVGHGDETQQELSGYTAEGIAELLVEDLGIKHAKKISLLACELGIDNRFIEDLILALAELSSEQCVPAVSAYKGNLAVCQDGSRIVDLGEKLGIAHASTQKNTSSYAQLKDAQYPHGKVFTP